MMIRATLTLLLTATTASAQGLVHLRIDNDSFAQIDRWYSHRHELGWTGQIYRAPDGPTVALQVRAGQAMWTPRNIQFVDPPERDMPFAGYLYGDVGTLLRWPSHTLQLRLRLGVIGPAAQAGPTQEAIHTVLGVRQPRGWPNQLPNQFAGHLTATYAAHHLWELDGMRIGGATSLRVDAGNLASRAHLSVALVAAHGLDSAVAAEIHEPTLSSVRCRGVCLALFVGGQVTSVFRDLVLEARGAAAPPDITRRDWVGTLRFGFFVGGRRAWMRYVHVRQTRVFDTATNVHPKNHRWGVLEIGVPYG